MDVLHLPGTLWNMKANLPAARQAQTVNAVVATLSQCLDLDAGGLILELRASEEASHRSASPATETEEPLAARDPAEEEMIDEEEPLKEKSKAGKATKADSDFSDLLPVSNTCRSVGTKLNSFLTCSI